MRYIVLALIVVTIGYMAGSYQHRQAPYESRIEQLEEDGRQYNAGIVAIQRCLRNVQGYPHRRMLGQCLDDWFEANAARYGVDY